MRSDGLRDKFNRYNQEKSAVRNLLNHATRKSGYKRADEELHAVQALKDIVLRFY